MIKAGDCLRVDTTACSSCEYLENTRNKKITDELACDDCSVELKFDINCRVASINSTDLADISPTQEACVTSSTEIHAQDLATLSSINKTRGPPPMLATISLPLFIWHSVFIV